MESTPGTMAKRKLKEYRKRSFLQGKLTALRVLKKTRGGWLSLSLLSRLTSLSERISKLADIRNDTTHVLCLSGILRVSCKFPVSCLVFAIMNSIIFTFYRQSKIKFSRRPVLGDVLIQNAVSGKPDRLTQLVFLFYDLNFCIGQFIYQILEPVYRQGPGSQKHPIHIKFEP